MYSIMSYKIKLTPEGVDTLRQWADAISYIMDDIVFDTEKVIKDYKKIENKLGIHSNLFEQMTLHIKKAMVLSIDAVEDLPKRLHITADKIEAYIYDIPYDEGDAGSTWQRVKKR